ncbi:hypothetical protein Aperf_G00000027600 [Anoplocephala perfoliata]
MSCARWKPTCVANESQIFAFGNDDLDVPGAFNSEFLEANPSDVRVQLRIFQTQVSRSSEERKNEVSAAELLSREPGENAQKTREWDCDASDEEMVNVSTGADDCQWTSLASLGPFKTSPKDFQEKTSLNICCTSDAFSFAFPTISNIDDDDVYAVELETDPKIQREKLRQMKGIAILKGVHGVITYKFPSS